MSKKHISILLLFALNCFLVFTAQAQTSVFTYQGRLTDTNAAANGTYHMKFSLFGSLAGNDQIGTTLTFDGSGGNPAAVDVANGIFTVNLNFTAPNAFDGSARWLEMAVKKPAEADYTTLTPRQPITSSPYSIRTLSAATADNANNLGGIAASQFVQTTDPRLSDARTPLAGSNNYIQNTTAAQTADFNISGNGTIGGNLTVTGTLNALLGQNVTSAFGTGGASVTTAVWQIIPGLTQTITVPANSNFHIFVTTDGGVQNTGAADTSSIIDVAVHINAALLGNAGFKRLTVHNVNAMTGAFEYWSMGSSLVLTPGTYTIDVRTRKSSSTTANATVSGNNTTVLQGHLTIFMLKK